MEYRGGYLAFDKTCCFVRSCKSAGQQQPGVLDSASPSAELRGAMGGNISVTADSGSAPLSARIVAELADQCRRAHLTDRPWRRSERATCCGPVVDDSDINRRLMLETLRPTGFRLSEATNGLECLRQFELLRPHLVLMDLRMPEIDGHQSMRHLRARYAHSVRIIAVTASAFEEDAPEILRSGADQVRKPCRLENSWAIQRQLTALGADDRGFFPES